MRYFGPVAMLVLILGCGHTSPAPDARSVPDLDTEPSRSLSTHAEPATERYVPGTPSWVPLIDACMREGGSRGDCIAALPEEELAALEQWERENASRRREYMRQPR